MSGSDKPRKPATKIVTGGRSKALTGAVVNAPVWRASTHLYDDVAALEAGKSKNEDGRFFYGRRGSPTQWSLSDALTELVPGAPTPTIESGPEWLARQPEGVQRSVLGPRRYDLWARGDYPPEMWSVRKESTDWRPSYHVGPVPD